MLEDTVSGDQSKRRPLTNEQFLAQWTAFVTHYRHIVNAVGEKKLSREYAQQIIDLHYAPLKEIAPFDLSIRPEFEWKLQDGIDAAAERAFMRVDQRAQNKAFVAVKEEEARVQQKMRMMERIGMAIGVGAAFLGYAIEKGYVRNLDGLLKDQPILAVGGIAAASALVGHYLNLREGRTSGSFWKPVRDKLADASDYARARFAAGMLAIAGLLGMFTGTLPKEYMHILHPHKTVDSAEAINASLKTMGIVFPEDAAYSKK